MYRSKKRFLRLAKVVDRTGKSRSAVYRDMANNQFPASIKTGENTVAWLESDIDDWIDSRIAASSREVID